MNIQYIIIIVVLVIILLAILKATKKEIKNTTLQVNDEEQEGNIILSLMYSENNYFNIWYSIFGITITSSYIALAKERKKHEK